MTNNYQTHFGHIIISDTLPSFKSSINGVFQFFELKTDKSVFKVAHGY